MSIKFLLPQKKLVSTKIGADFFSENVSSLASLTPLSIQLGLQCFYYADLKCLQDDAQAAVINTYLTACNAKIGVFVSLEIDNYMSYLDWVIKVFGSKLEFIQMHQERIDISNDLYVARCHEMMAKYPKVLFSWNCGLLTKNDQPSQAINALIAKQIGTDRGRQYSHLSDGATFTINQQTNLTAIQNYFNVFLPNIQTQFNAAMTNPDTHIQTVKKQVILQWNEYVNAEMLSPAVLNLAIGEMSRFTLTNTENYSGLMRQSITNLIVRSATTPSYISLKRTVPLYKYKYTIPLTLTGLTGCTAQGFSDGASAFSLLINNSTSSQFTLKPSDISIKGKSILGNFNRDTGWATDLNAQIQNEIISEAILTIKPYSCNVVSFKTV